MRFRRTKQLIGEDGHEKLKNSFVVVIGLGAVGGYAVEALARAGVGRLRLVDFDKVSFYNINRQLYALDSTVDRYKTDVAFERVKDINPECDVEVLNCFAHAESMDEILADEPDLVIDAIDSVNPKTELLVTLQERGIKVISSMGAALRTDPSYIKVGKLCKVHHCTLARMIRKRLKKRKADMNFLCVYSTEPTDKLLISAIESNDDEPDMLKRGRKRKKLGSLPTLPGIFGLVAANTAIQILLQEK